MKTRRQASRKARTPRFHVPDTLESGAELALSKEASRHLISVLRSTEGDIVCLFNGDGNDYLAEVIDTRRKAQLRITERRTNPSESPLTTTLVQGISRGDRMDATVRQAVELGVNRIVPVQTQHGAIKLDPSRAAKRHAHWQGIVLSACEQSGRSRVPVLDPVTPLGDWLADRCEEGVHGWPADHTQRSSTGLVLVPGASESIADIALEQGPDVTIVIGPESGLDVSETDAAVKAGLRAANLGPRVLRTETAGPAALSLLQSRHGDL